MHPSLERICAADAHDRTLADLRKKKARLIETLATAKTRATATTAEVARLEAERATNQARQRELIRSVETYGDRLRSARGVLESGGGDPDAAARQVDSVTAKIDELETETLELMEALEELVALHKRAVEQRDQALAFLEAEDANHVPELEKVRAKAAVEVPLRDAELAEIEPHYAERYRNLVSRKGRGLAEVVNKACSACQMAVRPQHFADLERDLIHTCGGCQRFLVVLPAE